MKTLLAATLMGAFLLTVATPAQAPKAAPKTLAEVIPTWKWDPAQAGPLLVLDAAKTRASGGKTDLASFARQQIKVGELTVVVPTQMVVIDDSFGQEPSLTDGLPMDVKVLYLLTTLTKEQWRTAAGNGLGLGDLQGEQKAVLESIFPKRLKWRLDRVKADGNGLEEVKTGELTEKEILGMKLRIARDLVFQPNLVDNANGYTIRDTDSYLGKPGDLRVSREWWEDKDTESFGVNVRQSLPNALKPSQLPYADAAFEPAVRLTGLKTVREALAAASRATGREILADVRVADLPLTVVGSTASARDLLKALALAVTGTYRQVGSAYLLTSDLMGGGTRKLRFALWWEDLSRRSYDLRREWQGKIGETIDRATFDKDSPFVPNERMKAYLETQDENRSRNPIQAEELTPAVREYLNHLNRTMPQQKIQTSQTVMNSTIRFGFVLPDGRRLPMEHRSLGDRADFEPQIPYQPRELAPPQLPAPLPEGKIGARVAFRVETAGLAKSAVELAHVRGFREIWLETHNAAALKAATEAAAKHSLPVRLIVRPWSAPTQDPDRNVLGDTGDALESRLEGLALWKRMRNSYGVKFIPDYLRISPADPNLSAIWGSYVALAQTPGLSGVVLDDACTTGYEPGRNNLMQTSRGLAEISAFGFSAAQRLDFLRKHGTDPLDIVGDNLTAGPDLRQPFFLDDALRGVPTTYDGRDVPHAAVDRNRKFWSEYRAKAAETAIVSLLESIVKSTSALVELSDIPRTKLPFDGDLLAPYIQGLPLPSFKSFAPTGGEPPAVLFPLPADPKGANAANLIELLKQPGLAPTVDLRTTPNQSWAAILDFWFKRPNSVNGEGSS